MSELRQFLDSQGEPGSREGEGTFTVAPELARRKLADSVPPELSDPWNALSFIDAALRLSGLLPERSTLGGLGVVAITKLTLSSLGIPYLGLRYQFNGDEWGLPASNLRTSLIRACENPFGHRGAVEICLSRAALILAKRKVNAEIFFPGSGLPKYSLSNGAESEIEQWVQSQAKGKLAQGFVICFSTIEEWKDAFQRHRDDYHIDRVKEYMRRNSPLAIDLALRNRAGYVEPALLGVKLWIESVWTRAPSRELIEYGFCKHSGGWFDYRTTEAVLAEVFVPAAGASGLPVSLDCRVPQEEGEILRTAEHMSSWDRFRSQGEKLVLRWWESPPMVWDEGLHARAVFTIALSESASKVAFVNWGNTKENFSLDCPPGLGAFVYWPELKQSLYGESWVRDKAFQEALDWTNQQAKRIFVKLYQEFDYVWKMLQLDHVRKSYKPEVERRLRSWLGHYSQMDVDDQKS